MPRPSRYPRRLDRCKEPRSGKHPPIKNAVTALSVADEANEAARFPDRDPGPG